MNNIEFTNMFSFKEYQFENDYHVAFPKGSKYNYINILKQGSAEITVDDLRIKLNEGDIIFIPRGSTHHSHWYGKDCVVYSSFAFDSYPSLINKNPLIQKIKPNEKIIELIDKIPTGNNASCHSIGMFLLLLDEIFKTLETSSTSKEQDLLKAMKCIKLNLDRSIPKIARMCNFSTTTLHNLFKSQLDCTPAKYRLSAKLEQAMYYLTTTDMSIERISAICGFSSSSYFRKNFYKQYGKTPREARKTLY